MDYMYVVTGPVQDKVRLVTYEYEDVRRALRDHNDDKPCYENEVLSTRTTRYFTATGVYLVHRIPGGRFGVWM